MEQEQVISKKKRIASIILAALGIASMIAYSFCVSGCSFLSGTFLGIDLKYAGITFGTVLILSYLLKKDFLARLLLAAGLGAEIFLVGYQVVAHQFCLYCLIFAATIIGQCCLVSLVRPRHWLIPSGAIAAGFIFLLTFFSVTAEPSLMKAVAPSAAKAAEPGSATPAEPLTAKTMDPLSVKPTESSPSKSDLPLTFGEGPISIRLYTDYMCPPCSRIEPEIEEILPKLFAKGNVRVTFIDVPIHDESPLYTAQYVSLAGHNTSFTKAIKIRSALFGAARMKITDTAGICRYLQGSGEQCGGEVNLKPILSAWTHQMSADGISSTPTCVIEDKGNKQSYTGKEIVPALEGILKR